MLSPDALTSEMIEKVRQDNPVAACVSTLPPGGLAQAYYLCKRLRQHFPDLKIFVGRWGQAEDVERTTNRLKAAGATQVVASLQEMRREILPLLSLTPPEHAEKTKRKPATAAV